MPLNREQLLTYMQRNRSVPMEKHLEAHRVHSRHAVVMLENITGPHFQDLPVETRSELRAEMIEEATMGGAHLALAMLLAEVSE